MIKGIEKKGKIIWGKMIKAWIKAALLPISDKTEVSATRR